MSRCLLGSIFFLSCFIARTDWTHTQIFAAELAELGNSGVTGDVTILSAYSEFSGTDVVGAVKIRGLKANTMPECGHSGHCRTYLHTGSACTDEASQKSRALEGTGKDPWKRQGYHYTDERGTAEATINIDRYPDEHADFAGHPFIIHNEEGVRVACGVLRLAGLPVYTAKVSRGTIFSDSVKPPVEGEVMIIVSSEAVLGIGLLRNVEEGQAGAFRPFLSKESDCQNVPPMTPKAILNSLSGYGQATASYANGKEPPSSFRFTSPFSWFEGKGDLLAIEGKRITIYSAEGLPWSCGVLACSYWPVYTASLIALQPSSSISGMVTIATTRTALLGIGTATNLEKGVKSIADGGIDCAAEDACGVHVHKGDACTDAEGRSSADLQGDHYFSGETDPWASVGYWSTDSAGGTFFQFNVKSAAVKIAGKPFILHDKFGGRAACGILTVSLESQLYTTALLALSVQDTSPEPPQVGNAAMLRLTTGVIGIGSVSGLHPDLKEEACRADSQATCGAVLYDGIACHDKSAWGTPLSALSSLDMADEQAGWLTEDPWKSSRYLETDKSGAASFDFALTTGPIAISGKAFVVHDEQGKGVSCGIFTDAPRIVSGSLRSSPGRTTEIIVIILLLLVTCVGGVFVRKSFFQPSKAREQTVIDFSKQDVLESLTSRNSHSTVKSTESIIELTTKNSVKW